MMDWIIS